MSITFQGPTKTVTITRDPLPESGHFIERLNHKTKRLSGGNTFTLSMGPNLCIGELIIGYVKGDEARELEKLIVNDLLFDLHELTITPPQYFNLGLGFGVPITCRLTGESSTKNKIIPRNYTDRFNISLEYEFVIQDSQIGIGVNVN